MGRFKKRKALYQHLRDNKIDIAFLQETHCTEEKGYCWQNECGHRCYWSYGTTQSKGVGIILRNKKISVNKYFADQQGRFLIMDIDIENNNLLLSCVYGPNGDNPDFFKDFFQQLDSFENVNMIIGGDFNIVLNEQMDRTQAASTTRTPSCASTMLKQQMEEYQLADVWRTLNPETREFMWSRMLPTYTASRLDYFLISSALVSKVSECNISPGCQTDHRMVELIFQLSDFKRGPGIWKINNTILTDEQFQEQIKTNIEDVRIASLGPIAKWEYLKFTCSKIARQFSRNRADEKKQQLIGLRQLREVYETEYLAQPDLCENLTVIQNNLTEINAQIESIENERVNSAIFRSKAQWARQGEWNSKYFYSLEKRNYMNKSMFSVFIGNRLYTDQQQILDEQRKFYSELYKSNTDIDFKLKNDTEKRISKEQQINLDRPITCEELRHALNTQKNEKCPGNDGLSAEFYKTFWNDFEDIIWSMYTEVLDHGRLGATARKGLMQLIPKKNKDTRYVKNMRPLTLLNVDYKILATTIALRLRETLPSIIGDQQTGFMEGRSIHNNIRKTMDILAWVNNINDGESSVKAGEEYVIINLDFVKCFDMIEHQSVYGALRYFGYGEKFINYVKIFFTNFTVCTQIYGYTSSYFGKTRGINQGCPISPFLFLVFGEVMTHRLTLNPKVKGVPLGGPKQ